MGPAFVNGEKDGQVIVRLGVSEVEKDQVRPHPITQAQRLLAATHFFRQFETIMNRMGAQEMAVRSHWRGDEQRSNPGEIAGRALLGLKLLHR
jgi:hypothetical protein